MSEREQELRDRLEAARAELAGLVAEQAGMPARMREAEQEDHAQRLRAARTGGGIAAAISKVKSKVRGVKDRGEELPYEIWSARIRVAELELAHYEAIAPELDERVQEARAASHEAERELQEAEKRNRTLGDVYTAAMREQHAAYQRSQEVERELAALEANGPSSYQQAG